MSHGPLADFLLAEGLFQLSLGQRPRKSETRDASLAEGHVQPKPRLGKSWPNNRAIRSCGRVLIATRQCVLGSITLCSSRSIPHAQPRVAQALARLVHADPGLCYLTPLAYACRVCCRAARSLT